MNKKQEKAEMIKLIGNVKPFYVETIAKALYDAGYRRVDDVRKETAKEILQEWADDNSSMGLDNTFVKNIAKKYGVEVEE